MQLINKFEKNTGYCVGSLQGLRHYASETDALLSEACNDAVHMVYAHKLEKQAKLFLNSFRGDSLYAIKANPHPAIIKFLWSLGIRKFEMASLREVEYISELLPEAELYFMHPIKSRQAIRSAYEHGVKNFAFDSLEELKKIEIETGYAQDLSLFLRLKVDQESAAHPLNGKFGATLHEAPLLLQRANQTAKSWVLPFMSARSALRPITGASASVQRKGFSLVCGRWGWSHNC